MYTAVLENAGFDVERKINLGGTLIAHQALTTGAIDLYPEYTVRLCPQISRLAPPWSRMHTA